MYNPRRHWSCGVVLIASEKMLIAAELLTTLRLHRCTTRSHTTAYGQHIAPRGCHRLSLCWSIAAGPPDWPPAPNLTKAGNLKDWSEADFHSDEDGCATGR